MTSLSLRPSKLIWTRTTGLAVLSACTEVSRRSTKGDESKVALMFESVAFTDGAREIDGEELGASVTGDFEGIDVGEADGSKEGVLVGEELGVSLDLDGADVGVTVGNLVVGESVTGEALGEPAVTVGDVVVGEDEVGGNVGLEVGCAVGRLFVGVAVGLWIGIGVGWFVGTGVGPGVGRFVGGLVII